MHVQGRPSSRLWLLTSGEALVPANAGPLKVVGYGDAVGIASLLNGGGSPETTIALSAIRALTAGRDQFQELVSRPSIRARLAAALPPRGPRPRPQRGPSAARPRAPLGGEGRQPPPR